LAAAVAPPARLRLEALGPTGATRLVLATDGARAVALLVSERRFDSAAATPEALATWTGLPLGPAALVALLAGQAPCAAPSTDDDGALAADPCPNLHFEAAEVARTGEPGCSGTLVTRPGAEVLAIIECAGGEGGSWPERIRVDLPGSGRSVELRRIDGPAAALLGDALFAPPIPAGFRQDNLLSPTASGSLLEGERERTP
jgi:hypothetical protein